MQLADLRPDDLVERWRASSGSARERAGEALVERYERIVRAVVRDEAGDYGVVFRTKQERHELASDLLVTIFEAASSYDAARSGGDTGDGFEHWLRYTLRHQLAEVGGVVGAVELPDSWQRVGRIAARVTDSLTQELRRTPTLDEVRAGTLAYATQWARDRLDEAGSDSRSDELVVAKLRKQGTLGAIERLDQVMVLRTQTAAFDDEVGDGVGVVASGESTSLSTMLLAVLNDTERFAVERRFGLYDGREWTFEEIGAELSMEWPDVRRLVAAAVAKPRLPHAHYAYCAEAVVTVDDEHTVDPLQRFRQRTVHDAGAATTHR